MAVQEPRTVDRIKRRLEFETLISDLSSRFINLPPGEVDRAIEDALRRACEFLGIDLAVLWQWSSAAPEIIAPTHFFPPRGGVEPLEPLSQDQYPWVRGQMLAGRVMALRSLDALPAEAVVDRESARRSGIKSCLCLPLQTGGGPPIGALAFNTLRSERDWPDPLVNRMQLVAQVFANALARRQAEETLRESEARLSLAADSSEAGFWTLDYRTGVFWASERGRAVFGYSQDEAITLERFNASIHRDDRDLVRGAIERSAALGEPVNIEYRITLPSDGRVRWIISRGRPHAWSATQPTHLTGISIDVTERKRVEEAHRASEARLAAGADLAGLAYYEMDYGRGTAWVDDRFREVCGLPEGQHEAHQALRFWMEHLHPDDRPRVLELREQMHDGRLPQLTVEYRYLHPTGGEKWIRHVGRIATRDAGGRAVIAYGVLRDITESKRVEEELHDLSRRLIRAHEEERALLARELHDDVTQRLAVLAIDVGCAELTAPDGPHAEALRSVREGLVRLSEDIHALAYQLHPSVLEELGLAEALQAECERRRRQGHLELTVELDPVPHAVAKDAALCLFRVAQEALNNVARHAGARAASVTLKRMDGGLLLAVRDDGAGFDPDAPRVRRSLGMASMRERVRLVSGTLDIESAPGQGSTVIAWVPVEGEAR
jgi:PAS domain S-box-containing protein